MTQDIAALIGSRICHDLISPIGAIGNGVELLEMTQNSSHLPEFALINDSVQSANARINFFRIAFGAASGAGIMAAKDIRAILAATAQSGRFVYDWSSTDDHPRTMVRIAFLCLQCLETAMPLGGDIRVTCGDDQWKIQASATRINFDGALWATLARVDVPPYPFSAAQVQFALLPAALLDQSRDLTVDHDDSMITLRF